MFWQQVKEWVSIDLLNSLLINFSVPLESNMLLCLSVGQMYEITNEPYFYSIIWLPVLLLTATLPGTITSKLMFSLQEQFMLSMEHDLHVHHVLYVKASVINTLLQFKSSIIKTNQPWISTPPTHFLFTLFYL